MEVQVHHLISLGGWNDVVSMSIINASFIHIITAYLMECNVSAPPPPFMKVMARAPWYFQMPPPPALLVKVSGCVHNLGALTLLLIREASVATLPRPSPALAMSRGYQVALRYAKCDFTDMFWRAVECIFRGQHPA